MNRLLVLLSLPALALIAPALRAQAPVPTTLSYQGVLTDPSGNPVPDGAYAIQLRLFPAASGGSAVYVESHTVATVGGVFSAELGAGTPTTGTWAGTAFDKGYWLETAVGGTTLAPRTKLLTAPYARGLSLPYAASVSQSGYLLDFTNTSASGRGIQAVVTGTTGVRGESAASTGAGIEGHATSATGVSYGGFFRAASSSGQAVYGQATAASGTTYGVRATAASTGGAGVYGQATASSGTTYGVYGNSLSTSGTGVAGTAGSLSGTTAGVQGASSSSTGFGVLGIALSSVGVNYGVSGSTFSSSGYAGYFSGRVHVTGTLSKGGGSFEIDHPLDPERQVLRHSFVESPDMMNVYNGNVTTDARGYATVELPVWFEALNRDFRYQLTVIGTFAQAIVAERVQGNRFVIQTDRPNVEVSWQVTGIRHDAWAEQNRIVVEEEKRPEWRGRYLHPSAFGQPRERGVDYDPELEAARARLDAERAERGE